MAAGVRICATGLSANGALPNTMGAEMPRSPRYLVQLISRDGSMMVIDFATEELARRAVGECHFVDGVTWVATRYLGPEGERA